MRSFAGMDVLPTPPPFAPPRPPMPAYLVDGGIVEDLPPTPEPVPEAGRGTTLEWLLVVMFALAFVQSRRTRRRRASSPGMSSRRT